MAGAAAVCGAEVAAALAAAPQTQQAELAVGEFGGQAAPRWAHQPLPQHRCDVWAAPWRLTCGQA